MCLNCQGEFLVSDLREHAKDCNSVINIDLQDNVDNLESRAEVPEEGVTEPAAETRTTTTGDLISNAISVDDFNTSAISVDGLPDLYMTSRSGSVVANETAIATPDLLQQIINFCIDFCNENKITDPVDILRCIQKRLVYGRDLDLVDDSTTIDGETNFIMVNRTSLLETAFEEIAGLTDIRLTLQVQFYDEVEDEAM